MLNERDTSAPAIQTVLVVDDEVIARTVISEYLRHCGYRVIEAANSDEALAVLQHAEVRVDVVLCGMSKAGAASGFALAQWIRQHKSDTDIILAGSHARAATAAGELCDSGPNLAKPYEPQVVIDRIKQLLAQRSARAGRGCGSRDTGSVR
jgi:CheY-like chemotaxis protein